jgi:tripartite-type tricarboxylate transporter receptor subunit TctC
MDPARQSHRAETVIARIAIVALAALAGLASIIACAHANAQGKGAGYPDKPVRFLVGQSPGGATDVVARAVTQKMTENIGQSMVVDNRTGASGAIAATMVAKSTPDGYNILIVSSSFSINPSLYKNLPFDPMKDFAPITLIAEAPFLLVVHPSMPVKTVADLIALAKAKPDTLAFGSGGVGSSGQMAGELFMYLAGVKLIHVPYKGAGPALIDVIGGQVSLTFGSVISSLGHVRAGKLKTLGVTSAKRARALPDIPTIAESGVKGYSTTTWYGALAPANTPAGVVQKLNAEIKKALTAPEVGDHMAKDGAEPVGTTPLQFREFLGAEISKWRDLVRHANVRVE